MRAKTVIKALVELIEPVCKNVYFGRSRVCYPKVVGDLRQLTDDGYAVGFRLVLDIYTDDDDIISAYDIADDIRAVLSQQQGFVEGGCMRIYTEGTRYVVPEKDNDKITHVADSYAVYFYRNKED